MTIDLGLIIQNNYKQYILLWKASIETKETFLHKFSLCVYLNDLYVKMNVYAILTGYRTVYNTVSLMNRYLLVVV